MRRWGRKHGVLSDLGLLIYFQIKEKERRVHRPFSFQYWPPVLLQKTTSWHSPPGLSDKTTRRDSQWLGARQASGQRQWMTSHTKRLKGLLALPEDTSPSPPKCSTTETRMNPEDPLWIWDTLNTFNFILEYSRLTKLS